MATLLNPATAGLPVTPVANAADATGNYVVPTGDMVIRIANGGGTPVNVVLDDPTTPTPEGTSPGAPFPDVTIAVPNAGSRYIVLNSRRRKRFTNATNGRVSWTYSATPTSVTVEVVAV